MYHARALGDAFIGVVIAGLFEMIVRDVIEAIVAAIIDDEQAGGFRVRVPPRSAPGPRKLGT